MRWRPDYINCLVKRGGEFIILPNLLAIFSSRHDAAGAVS
jgi:purine-binding chemotaxis protein CheW